MCKPKVTVALFCYNQEKFIEESIKSAFEQDYLNLKIVISDDCSTDNTYAIAKSLVDDYEGNHIVTLNQNPINLGIGKHFAYIMDNFAVGDLVVPFGGDDISKSNRVTRIVEEWANNDKPSLIAHNLEEIDEQGQFFIGNTTSLYKNNHSKKANKELLLYNYMHYLNPIPYIGAAIAYNLDTYLKFGTPEVFPDFEDHLMYFRSLISNGTHYFDDVLVKYRRHNQSYTVSQVKPKLIIHNQSFSAFQKTITQKNILSYRWHQVIVQQWLDYTTAIKKNFTNAEYTVIDNIWNSISLRHNYLTKDISDFEINYVSPLKAVLYGAGGAGKNSIRKLSKGFDIVSACDSNTMLHGKTIDGIGIISPIELSANIDAIDCILIASMYYLEIKQYLVKELNIPINKIIRLPFNITNEL